MARVEGIQMQHFKKYHLGFNLVAAVRKNNSSSNDEMDQIGRIFRISITCH